MESFKVVWCEMGYCCGRAVYSFSIAVAVRTCAVVTSQDAQCQVQCQIVSHATHHATERKLLEMHRCGNSGPMPRSDITLVYKSADVDADIHMYNL